MDEGSCAESLALDCVDCDFGVEAECGIGSAVTAKRMCSMAFDNCCLGCGFFDTLLSV